MLQDRVLRDDIFIFSSLVDAALRHAQVLRIRISVTQEAKSPVRKQTVLAGSILETPITSCELK